MTISLAMQDQLAAKAVFEEEIWLGDVKDVDGNRVVVQRRGEETTSSYPRLASYTPAVNDEVLVIHEVVVGKILR